jgi:hypothetical protein
VEQIKPKNVGGDKDWQAVSDLIEEHYMKQESVPTKRARGTDNTQPASSRHEKKKSKRTKSLVSCVVAANFTTPKIEAGSGRQIEQCDCPLNKTAEKEEGRKHRSKGVAKALSRCPRKIRCARSLTVRNPAGSVSTALSTLSADGAVPLRVPD